MNSIELVSVVIPVSGNPIYLNETIGSITSQTYPNLEIIVVLNQAQDWVLKWLELAKSSEPRLRILETQSKGISNALNLGIEESMGNLICRIDADDIMLPERIACQVKFLSDNPEIGLVGSQITKIDETGNVIGKSTYPNNVEYVRKILKIRNCIAHPTVMMRKEYILKAGGYRTPFDGIEDYELWLRLLKITALSNTEEALTLYRVWQAQETQKSYERRSSLARILRFSESGVSGTAFDAWYEMDSKSLSRYANKLMRKRLLDLAKSGKFFKFCHLVSLEKFNCGIDQIKRSNMQFHTKIFAVKSLALSIIFDPLVFMNFVRARKYIGD